MSGYKEQLSSGLLTHNFANKVDISLGKRNEGLGTCSELQLPELCNISKAKFKNNKLWPLSVAKPAELETLSKPLVLE